LLLSDGDYGNVFPSVAGMLLTGLGMALLGIIRARAEALYPETLIVRAFFLVCLGAFFLMTRDPLFLVLIAVVAFGFVLTGLTYLTEKNRRVGRSLVFFNPCHRSIDAAPGGAGGRGLEIMKAATSQACCSESTGSR